MNKIQIEELITFLKADSTLNPIFWSRVFYIAPVNDTTWLSLFINVLSENRKQDVNETLVDFRVVSTSIEVWPLEIVDYLDIIRNIFEKNHYTVWSTKYFQIDPLNDVFVWQNIKQHYEWVTSFIFKNAK